MSRQKHINYQNNILIWFWQKVIGSIHHWGMPRIGDIGVLYIYLLYTNLKN